MARQPEGLIQKAILEYLGLQGIMAWGNKNGGTFDPKKRVYRRNTTVPGISDILGVLPGGRALAIEVKRPKPNYREPTVAQKQFIKRINEAGGLAFVATSVEDVKQALGGVS